MPPLTLPEGNALVVEDDGAQRFLVQNVVQAALEGTGFGVEAYPDAESALARRAGPHGERLLVITDYRLPGLDGVGLVRRLQAHPGGTAHRYVVFTSCSHLADDPAVRAAGVDRVVVKPEDAYACRDAVRVLVEEWLEGLPCGRFAARHPASGAD